MNVNKSKTLMQEQNKANWERNKTFYWKVEEVDDERYPLRSDVNETIEDYIGIIDPKEMPKTITVVAYQRMRVTEKLNVLGDILDSLDETYGDEYCDDNNLGQSDESLRKMQDAETEFIKIILENYVPASCEPVPGKKFTVDVKYWIELYRPQWLNEGEFIFKDKE